MDTLAKKLYMSLESSGDLKELYPNLHGEWEKDKKEFIRNYEINQELINGTEVEFDNISEEYTD